MDISDRVRLATLLSEYGALLTDRQREMLRLYVEMDMSLNEVAEEFGVTRQAVLDAVRHGADSLQKYEDAVGKLSLKTAVRDRLDRAVSLDGSLKDKLAAVYEVLED